MSSPRPRTKPMANIEDDMNGRKSGLMSRPSTPESPVVATKLKSKIPKSNRRYAERAFPQNPATETRPKTEGSKGNEKLGPEPKLGRVGRSPSSANRGGGGRIEIKLPDERSGGYQNSGISGRYNHQLETNELRTLLKLPRDTPSAQVIHKLREAFHFMDIVERYKTDLQRLLQTKEAKSHEGVLKTVKELLLENESLKQSVERHQEIIAKLQEDKRSVLERFHKLMKEHRIKDYGSGSSLAFTNHHGSHFPSQDGGLTKSYSGNLVGSAGNLLPSASFGELTVPATGEKKDLATMLSSRIDHMLKPAANNNSPEQKGLSPIYIRQKKSNKEKKMVYKITGIIRPASSVSSSQDDRPRTMGGGSAVVSAANLNKLPEIFARKKTPTPAQKLKMLMDSESVTNTCNSSLTSVTEASTSSLGENETEYTSDTLRSSRVGSAQQRRIRIRPVDKNRYVTNNDANTKPCRTVSNLVSMSKRYSSSALSAAGSVGVVGHPQQYPPPPSSVAEHEESMGDLFDSISDIKKDDIISLIFAPLLKDRYMSKFSVDSEGGVLTMQEIGVTLAIPNGAIPTGQTAEIILGVSYNPIDTPISPYAHTNASSTILCATQPSGLTFKRPAFLAFAHNTGNMGMSKGKGTPRILQSFTDIGHTTKWEDFTDLEDEGEGEFGSVTSEYCVMYLSELRLISMVMEQATSKTPSKYVRVVTYVNYSPGRDCVGIHVYCIDNLPSERQLLRRECSQDNIGLEIGEQPMILNANEGDIIVSIRNIPAGWHLLGQSHQSLSYRKVWQNLHPHVTFLIQCDPDTWESELTCSIHTQQLNTDDQDSATDIAICCDLAQIEGCSDSSVFENGTMNSGLRSFLRAQQSSGDYFTPNVFDAGSCMLLQDTDADLQIGEDLRALLFDVAAWPREVTPTSIPPALVHEMASMLDPPNLLGLDWRQLASELDLDGCVPALTTVGKPTEHLMQAVEVLCSGLYELQAKLEAMGRDDAASVVRAYMARLDNSNTQKRGPKKIERHPLSCRF